MKSATYVLGLCLMATACSTANAPTPAGDMVLTNGKIYTSDDQKSWAEAVVISGQTISFVGSDEGAEAYIGDNTQIVDLNGKLVLPGLNDMHVHPVYGFTAELYECAFRPTFGPDDIRAKIAQCVAEQPDAEWIVGGQWETDFFVKYDLGMSPREWLDEVSGDKAVLLRDSSFHNSWANSKALELAGVTAETPHPEGGFIVPDENGTPSGILNETAVDLVAEFVPGWTREQYKRAAIESLKSASSFGITGLKEASGTPPRLRAYKDVETDIGLDVHIAASISADQLGGDSFDIDKVNELRDTYGGVNLDTRFVKLFQDGVPSASRTAAMLQPYVPLHEHATPTRGKLLHTPESLKAIMVVLDQNGYTVKTHAAGDWAVRTVLDAIEEARTQNGDSGLRHEVGHAGFVDPDDIPRFVELGASPELSPYIWFPSVKTESIIRAVGYRGEQYWPVRDMLDSGATVLAGSDYPAGSLSSMNPWVGMEALISRKNPWGEFPGVLWEEQAITLEEALHIYTRNGALGLRMENKTGSIEPGKLADIIVLNQNLFEIPVEAISDTQVEMTIFEGRIVHRRSAE